MNALLSDFALHLLISSGALLVAGFALHALLRHRPAAVQELLWRTVFSILLLLPLTWFFRGWGLREEVAAAPASGGPAREERVAALLPAAQAREETTRSVASAEGPSAATVWLCIWGAGSLLLLARTAAGPLLRRRWLSAARECADARVNALWRALPGTPRARLLVSPACPVPLTWHRTVLLPEEALHWSDEQVRAALQHETEHLRRGDSLFRRAGECAAALLWPQVLLWPARRLWHRLQEQACDDAVLRGGSDAAAYAELLCQAARGWRQAVAGTLAMAQTSSLERRIRAVLNPRGNRGQCARRQIATAFAAGLLCFTGAALAQKPAPAAPPKGGAAADSPDKVKAMKLIVPRVVFAEAKLADVIDYIRGKSKELDPDKKGIVLKAAPAGVAKKVTLDLRDVTLWQLLNTVAEATGTTLQAGPDGISFVAGAGAKPKAAAASPVQKKAEGIRIERVAFQGATAEEMIEYLRHKAREKDDDKTGVNIVLHGAGTGTYSLQMTDASVWEVLTKIAEVSGMEQPAAGVEGGGDIIVLERRETAK